MARTGILTTDSDSGNTIRD